VFDEWALSPGRLDWSLADTVIATTNGAASVSVETQSIEATRLSGWGFSQVREKSQIEHPLGPAASFEPFQATLPQVGSLSPSRRHQSRTS
jgi:hypothetical protein